MKLKNRKSKYMKLIIKGKFKKKSRLFLANKEPSKIPKDYLNKKFIKAIVILKTKGEKCKLPK